VPLYFAYGANMNVKAMAGRCPGSHPLGRARLARHRFFIMTEGFASVTPDSRASVHGVLWDLALRDVRVLDRFEDVARGLYRKIHLPVLREPAGSARALVYIGNSAEQGPPAPDYLPEVIQAARDWSLPPAYLLFLENIGRPAREGI